MNADGLSESRSGFWASVLSLLASSGTLVCCALPALLVALGAGAVLSSLVSAVPQLVWLSEHKEALFGFAGLMLTASGWLQWRSGPAQCLSANAQNVSPGLRCQRAGLRSGRLVRLCATGTFCHRLSAARHG
jgi:hypothetical protein